jgi:hypothetical protein
MELALFKNRQFARKIRYNGHQFGQIRANRDQVQCRLSEVTPVRAKGFDHTTGCSQ